MPPKTDSSPKGSIGGGRGSMGGGISGDAVSMDRLWSNRIAQELAFQRQWKDEFGFLSSNTNSPNNKSQENLGGDSGSNNNSAERSASRSTPGGSDGLFADSQRLTQVLLSPETAVGTMSATVDITAISPTDLLALQKQLQKSQYTSTQQASYRFDATKLLELPGGHRKQKFKY